MDMIILGLYGETVEGLVEWGGDGRHIFCPFKFIAVRDGLRASSNRGRLIFIQRIKEGKSFNEGLSLAGRPPDVGLLTTTDAHAIILLS
jgi:hypothetical protein